MNADVKIVFPHINRIEKKHDYLQDFIIQS